jgi:CTP synthase
VTASEQTEFYSPMPPGYIKGRHKYVVVLGTVMSGLGKGIFSASLAKLLKDKGLVVTPIKMEGYLNIDAGTLNPYRHGEVFVLDDGAETDMDLGAYERMLDQNLKRRNFVTSGQLYSEILDRERHGGYLGRDVQMIPHVTGEVKRRLRELALHGDGERPADVVFVEVGGTVGDYENGFYIEALRELAFEEGQHSVCFVALTYVIEPPVLGEQKSKAAQLGIKRLMEAGVQPHIVACRAHNPCGTQVMQKIAMFSNVPQRRVFSLHDRESIYTIPEALRAEGIDREVLSILDLHDRVDLAHEDRSRERWMAFVNRLTATKQHGVTIGVAGKYVSVRDAYASIDKAVEHCSAALSCDVDLRWIETSDIDDDSIAGRLEGVDAVIVPGGFGSRGVEGKIACVRHARQTAIPFLGICLGFQIAVIEFARNVLGIAGANSTEFDARCTEPVISELPEQKKIERLGGTMRLGGQDVLVAPGSLAAHLYQAANDLAVTNKAGPSHVLIGRQPGPKSREGARGAGGDERPLLIRERFRHRYEVDPSYVARLEAAGLRFSGSHTLHPIMQVLELAKAASPSDQGARPPAPAHPFFIAAQYHPELTSRPLHPAPLFLGLIAAAIRRKDASAQVRWPVYQPGAAPVASIHRLTHGVNDPGARTGAATSGSGATPVTVR